MGTPRGPFAGRKTRIVDAEEQGGRDKYQPGSYYARIVKGVFRESAQVSGAEYFGVETVVVQTIAGKTSEENRPYQRSQRPGDAASWVFNLNPPQKSHQYLADGNVKNLIKAIMETEGFGECLDETEDEVLGFLLEAMEADRKLTPDEMEKAGVKDSTPDPFAYVADLLVGDGGEKFAGLPIRIVARDARNRKNVDARPFVACSVYPVDAEELAEHFGGRAAAERAA